MSKWLDHVKATIKKNPGIMKNGGLKEILKVASATYKKGASDTSDCKPCKGTKKRKSRKGKHSAKGGTKRKRSAKGGTKRKSRKH